MSRLKELEVEAEELSDEISDLEEELAEKNNILTAILDEIDFIERKRKDREFEKERV